MNRNRGQLLFLGLYLASLAAAYPFLAPEETRDFAQVAKEFRVMAFRDGKPASTTLAALSKRDPALSFLLPGGVVEIPGEDLHKATVLEKQAAWQLVEYEYANTVSSKSRYRAFRDRIEPVSHRLTFHPAMMVALVLLAIPVWILSLAINWLWGRLAGEKPQAAVPSPPPPPPQTRRSAGAEKPQPLPPMQAQPEPPQPPRPGAWIAIGLACVALGAAALYAMTPRYVEYLPRHKVMETVLALSSARIQLDQFYKEHKRLPKDSAEGDLAWALGPSSRVREARYREGELTAVITNITPELEGKMVVLRAVPAGEKLDWTCYSRGIPARDAPQMCSPK